MPTNLVKTERRRKLAVHKFLPINVDPIQNRYQAYFGTVAIRPLKSLIIIGVATPALSSLIFILQFGINSVYLDEWELVPLLKSSLTGQPWLQDLFVQSNEHHPVFPHLIFLGLAYLTSYNVIYEMLLGWALLGIVLFVLWRLVLQTFPEGKWIIIPIAWLAYSFSQYETFLWGEPSIAWYLTILMIVLTIYFLNKIKDSSLFIIPAIICGFVASFSLIVGLSVWLVGFFSFKNRSSLKLLLLYVPSAIMSFVLFFNGWTGLTVDQARTSIGNPLGFLTFVLAFLGNAVRIRGAENYGINAINFSSYVGMVILGIFLVTIFLYRHYHVKDGSKNIVPWLQLAILGLLFGIIAAGGRLGLFGVDMALSSRYVPLSNFFLIGTLVIALMTLTHDRLKNTPRNRKIVKISIIVLLVLVCFDIILGNIVGLLGAVMFHEKIATGTSCLLNFESSSDNCLQKLYPNTDILKERAKILRDLCLGPFASSCK